MSTITFEAQRGCRMAGRRFRRGDKIHVSVDTEDLGDWTQDAVGDWFQRTYVGKGGPWGYGGFRSQDIMCIASEITDDRGEPVFHGYRGNKEYYLVYETCAEDYAVGPFHNAIKAHAFGNLQVDSNEGIEEFVIVAKSKVPKRILRVALNPLIVSP